MHPPRIDRLDPRVAVAGVPGIVPSPAPLHHRAHAAHVLNEDIFKSILIRERQRADRLEAGLILLLVAIDARDRSATTRHLIAALSVAKRRSDLLGWFDQGRVIGLILPETGPSPALARRVVEERVRRHFEERLTAESISRVRMTMHVHPASDDVLREGFAPAPQVSRSGRSRGVTRVTKRALDIVLSGAALAVLAPVMLAIAAIVRLTSKGPALFRQTRVGQEGKPFTMLKFRTMVANADHAVHKEYVSSFIKGNGQPQAAGDNQVFKLTQDPRVTPLGRVLRKTSLDELPQFINVLSGKMSLVGPRPPLPYEVEQYKSWHRRRVLDAKPGITGLWQLTGRSRTTFEEMVRLDLRYARTPSVWTDIKILAATPRAVVTGRGAC
jgi:lipopolysaccharide/colanic/teichoic acid biosynthesis glycosyltransferase